MNSMLKDYAPFLLAIAIPLLLLKLLGLGVDPFVVVGLAAVGIVVVLWTISSRKKRA